LLTAGVRAPFNVEERRALMGASLTRFTCPPPNVPMRDLVPEGFYADRDASVVNADALARYRDAIRPLTLFQFQVTSISDAFVGSRPADRAPARCALDWLEAWAGQNALLGRVSRQGVYDRTWALVAIAAAYLKVAGEQPSPKVEAWIRRLAEETLAYQTSRTGDDTRNNHAYWAGAALGLAAAAVDQKPWLTWAIGQFRLGMSQVAENGTLPLELARKGQALHYHDFALIPLVQIAEVAFQNGSDLYREAGGPLGRLASLVVTGLDDPSEFGGLTGVGQTWISGLNGIYLVWMEPYYARTRDRRLVPWLERYRPLRAPWIGGDATLLYGAKDLS